MWSCMACTIWMEANFLRLVVLFANGRNIYKDIRFPEMLIVKMINSV